MAPIFPEQQAAIIVEYAQRLGKHAVLEIIDKIRDMLGHPEKVEPISMMWDPEASNQVRAAKEGLYTMQAGLDAWWEGSAYDAFTTYMKGFTESFSVLETTMTEAAQVLDGMAALINQTYQEAIRFISRTAAEILRAVGGILGNIKDRLGLLGAVADALANFMELYGDLMASITGILHDYRSKAREMVRAVGGLTLPPTVPTAIGIPGAWDVTAQN